jgi:cation/acetate symporter
LFIPASSAISHDIYANIVNEDAMQRQQVLVGRLSIGTIGLFTIVFALGWVTLVSLLFECPFATAPPWASVMFMLAGVPAYSASCSGCRQLGMA